MLNFYQMHQDDILTIEEPEYIPNSWVENGIRKVFVWDEDVEVRYEFVDGKLKECSVF